MCPTSWSHRVLSSLRFCSVFWELSSTLPFSSDVLESSALSTLISKCSLRPSERSSRVTACSLLLDAAPLCVSGSATRLRGAQVFFLTPPLPDPKKPQQVQVTLLQWGSPWSCQAPQAVWRPLILDWGLFLPKAGSCFWAAWEHDLSSSGRLAGALHRTHFSQGADLPCPCSAFALASVPEGAGARGPCWRLTARLQAPALSPRSGPCVPHSQPPSPDGATVPKNVFSSVLLGFSREWQLTRHKLLFRFPLYTRHCFGNQGASVTASCPTPASRPEATEGPCEGTRAVVTDSGDRPDTPGELPCTQPTE